VRRKTTAIILILIIIAIVANSIADDLQNNTYTIGSIITLGQYEQDNNEENGPEEIEWIVLDVKGEKCLLISRYALDVLPYNVEDKNITWEKCSLRTWLNEDFLQEAFSEEERKLILNSEVDNTQKQGLKRWNNWKKTKGGNNTVDQVFLLSYLEANHYFGVKWTDEDEDIPSGTVRMTEYVRQRTANSFFYRGLTEDNPEYGLCNWWLRSPGYLQNLVAVANRIGALIASESTSEDVGVRPALWMTIKTP